MLSGLTCLGIDVSMGLYSFHKISSNKNLAISKSLAEDPDHFEETLSQLPWWKRALYRTTDVVASDSFLRPAYTGYTAYIAFATSTFSPYIAGYYFCITAVSTLGQYFMEAYDVYRMEMDKRNLCLAEDIRVLGHMAKAGEEKEGNGADDARSFKSVLQKRNAFITENIESYRKLCNWISEDSGACLREFQSRFSKLREIVANAEYKKIASLIPSIALNGMNLCLIALGVSVTMATFGLFAFPIIYFGLIRQVTSLWEAYDSASVIAIKHNEYMIRIVDNVGSHPQIDQPERLNEALHETREKLLHGLEKSTARSAVISHLKQDNVGLGSSLNAVLATSNGAKVESPFSIFRQSLWSTLWTTTSKKHKTLFAYDKGSLTNTLNEGYLKQSSEQCKKGGKKEEKVRS